MKNLPMNDVTRQLLESIVAYTHEYMDDFLGAYNIRENGECIARESSENIKIESKTDKPGLNITVKPGTKGETIYIPACVTQGGIDDTVYNDFFIGPDCDIKITSACGVHTEDASMAKHSGVHHLFIGENSKVYYHENHVGAGDGDGTRSINPVTTAELGKNSYLEIDATQISGIDKAYRTSSMTLEAGAKLVIHERLFTEKQQKTTTKFKVELNGDGSSADVVSRSVARDQSYQSMDSVIIGNAVCTGHSECDSIIGEDAIVDASPRLFARNKEAALIHEAAIGKIAGEQIQKLKTLGLTQEQAEQEIIEGFLS